MKYEYFSEIYTNEKQFLREKMQYFFDKSLQEKNEHLLRHQYVALRRLQFTEEIFFTPEYVNLSALAQNIANACDILSFPSGVNFIFCGNDSCYTRGNPKLIGKALLNLLSNAYLYGNKNLITIKTITTRKHAKIEVLSGGTFQETNYNGKGLELVRKICKKNNGNFFVEQGRSYTRAIMIFEKINTIPFNHNNEEFDTYTLICDRLSPVCVEMFGMEYH